MAVTFAVAYALCVLAPPVARAFVDGAAVFHCLTDRHGNGAAMAHVHEAKAYAHNAAGHDHGGASSHRYMGPEPGEGKADANGAAFNCCGYFCLSAMPAGPAPGILPAAHVLPVVAAVDNGIAGCGPDRIDRPPIVLLPL